MRCGMKGLIAVLALTGSIAVPANAETYGVAFAVPSGVNSGYSAVGVNLENKVVFRLDMNTLTNLGFMTILSATAELSADQVTETVAICWGGGDAVSQKQGCRPVEWEMGWHSVYPLSEGAAMTN